MKAKLTAHIKRVTNGFIATIPAIRIIVQGASVEETVKQLLISVRMKYSFDLKIPMDRVSISLGKHTDDYLLEVEKEIEMELEYA
jgi:hypothetical protein